LKQNAHDVLGDGRDTLEEGKQSKGEFHGRMKVVHTGIFY
jgi:hypothetical protein